MKNVGFAVVGVGGFAAYHIDNLQSLEANNPIELTAVVCENQKEYFTKTKDLRKQGIKVFDSYSQLLNVRPDYVDIIVLPTSIHTHASMAIDGMENGFNILLEKPPAPTVSQLDRLIETQDKTNKFCSIGFQFIHSHSIQRLKKIIKSGRLGKIQELSCKGYWPRSDSYYQRNGWAGNLISNGQLVLDGPMHNAFSHFLNNMLYLAFSEQDEVGTMKTVRAELYRAHRNIHSPDTACLEAEIENGTKVNFYVTHAPERSQDPYMEIIGTKGKAFWNYNENTKVQYSEGGEITFDDNGLEPALELITDTAEFLLEKKEELYCSARKCRNFVVTINGAYDSAAKIHKIPDRYINKFETEEKEIKTEIQEINKTMDKAFASRDLLSDTNTEWAKKGDPVNLIGYNQFNLFSTS